MSRRRPGVGVERPVDDLGDQVRRCVEHILVGRPGGRVRRCLSPWDRILIDEVGIVSHPVLPSDGAAGRWTTVLTVCPGNFPSPSLCDGYGAGKLIAIACNMGRQEGESSVMPAMSTGPRSASAVVDSPQCYHHQIARSHHHRCPEAGEVRSPGRDATPPMQSAGRPLGRQTIYRDKAVWLTPNGNAAWAEPMRHALVIVRRTSTQPHPKSRAIVHGLQFRVQCSSLCNDRA